MEQQDIHLEDIKRILFGTAPATFLLEVFLRTVIIYCFLLVVVRLLGKRMSGQITITELAVMLLLGAIISVPTQTPDRGLVQGFLLMSLVLVTQYLLTGWTAKNVNVERTLNGTLSVLIVDGIMQVATLQKARISKDQLFAIMRSKRIYNLGEVERFYLEACGLFSIYKFKEKKAGLTLLPPDDKALREEQKKATDKQACSNCGFTVQGTDKSHCPSCHRTDWQPAVL